MLFFCSASLFFFLPIALFATLLSPQMRNRKLHTSSKKNKPNNKGSMNDLEKIAIGNKIRQTSKRTNERARVIIAMKRKEKHKIDVMWNSWALSLCTALTHTVHAAVFIFIFISDAQFCVIHSYQLMQYT